ncbi:TetR/AcrR family transcriptional regulator [Paenibacillus mucilaginosus]|uniref:Transcriptional regulator, TetR family n=1 Tax=Paenibacillus mucilaginosus (strain KNP414) TaxID=1036673 RepID=F8FE00_PAEMK|nr:TetR/AcrR family transcriptional regulator [Paenibacillus mucilaginosus]AEI43200.1 transcriptional regulator, TetR family [Paenibacillus mucilaginosus KNP414]MCG7212240.1 TetR/AcrR family transcriptional regulator [Paenibacillus mucilaginosus]WDM24794.1 TetR/AcrR family transcriptional regulator [Paenibacillus mucilaginosus]
MPRNPERDQQLREERRRQILDAAARLFARQGMLSKISDIAAEAGLSHGHVYNYFKSKEEILLAVIELGQLRYGAILRTAIGMEGTAADKFRCVARMALPKERSADIYLVLLQALFTDQLNDEEKQVIRERAGVNRGLLMTLIEEGQRDGTVLQGDPVQLASLFGTLIQNLMLLEMRGHPPADETTIDLLLQMIGP